MMESHANFSSEVAEAEESWSYSTKMQKQDVNRDLSGCVESYLLGIHTLWQPPQGSHDTNQRNEKEHKRSFSNKHIVERSKSNIRTEIVKKITLEEIQLGLGFRSLVEHLLSMGKALGSISSTAQTILQSHSNKNSIVLVQKQT
jgi:hypothetical protein